MAFNSRARFASLCGAAKIAGAVMVFSGCISSRSLIEDLAKTPRHPVQDSERYGTLNFFQQDLLYLTETLRDTHPQPYAAWSREEFDAEQDRILASLAAETSRVVFEGFLQSFLSRLRDSHTSVQLPWTPGQREYPVSFFWIKDTLVLASAAREVDTTLIGSRVLAFNQHPTEEVLSRFTRFIAYENIYQARRVLQYYFVFPAFHRDVGVLESDTLELKLFTRNQTERTYRVLPTEKPKRFYHFDLHPITQKVSRPFRYTILKEDSACYLQWNTMMDLRMAGRVSFPTNLLAYPVFWYMGIGYFDNFLEDMFEEMQDEDVRTLIVDLRGNGGGSSVYGEQLLYHLDVASEIRTYSMAIRFSPLYREFFPETYAHYSSRYSNNHTGEKLPDSLIVTSDIAQEDGLQGTYFQNVTDEGSDYHIEPMRRVFKGHVYFLVGDGTYSSAIILASMVKDNRLFTTVGQPTRGRPSHYGETLVLKLPNSGIVCRISCKKFLRPDVNKDSDDSLYPDVEIWPTIEDHRHGRDPVFDWVLQDAKRKTESIK